MRDALAGKVVTVIDERDQKELAAHEEEHEVLPGLSGVEQVSVSRKVSRSTTVRGLAHQYTRCCCGQLTIIKEKKRTSSFCPLFATQVPSKMIWLIHCGPPLAFSRAAIALTSRFLEPNMGFTSLGIHIICPLNHPCGSQFSKSLTLTIHWGMHCLYRALSILKNATRSSNRECYLNMPLTVRALNAFDRSLTEVS